MNFELHTLYTLQSSLCLVAILADCTFRDTVDCSILMSRGLYLHTIVDDYRGLAPDC